MDKLFEWLSFHNTFRRDKINFSFWIEIVELSEVICNTCVPDAETKMIYFY